MACNVYEAFIELFICLGRFTLLTMREDTGLARGRRSCLMLIDLEWYDVDLIKRKGREGRADRDLIKGFFNSV